MRGEYAAAKILTTLFSKQDNDLYNPKYSDYQMKLGYVEGTGLDQIWAVREKSGDVKKYVLVEAKGSRDAELGWPSVGQQMSAAWVISALMKLAEKGNRISNTAKKILDEIFKEDGKGKPVAGLIIQAAFSPENKGGTNNTVVVRRLSNYNMDAETAQRARETHENAFG